MNMIHREVLDSYRESRRAISGMTDTAIFLTIANEIHALKEEIRGLRSDLKQMDAKKGKEE